MKEQVDLSPHLSCAHAWRHRPTNIPEHTQAPRDRDTHSTRCTRTTRRDAALVLTPAHPGPHRHLSPPKTTRRYTHTGVPVHVPRNAPQCAHTCAPAWLHVHTHACCWSSKRPGVCPSLIPALNPRVQGAQVKGAAAHLASLEVIKVGLGGGVQRASELVFCMTSRDAASSELGFFRRFVYV